MGRLRITLFRDAYFTLLTEPLKGHMQYYGQLLRISLNVFETEFGFFPVMLCNTHAQIYLQAQALRPLL